MELLERQSQQWWKFSRYELQDGYIRPAPDATLQSYRPWDVHRAAQREALRDKQSPYVSLAALANELPDTVTSEDHTSLAPRVVKRTLEWCAEFGLLGVVLQQTRRVVFLPRLVEASPWNDEDDRQQWQPTPVLDQYFRESHVWRGTSSYAFAKGIETSRALSNLWEPVPEHLPSSLLPNAGPLRATHRLPPEWPLPHVETQAPGSSDWKRDSLSSGWFRFFPELTDHTNPTPPPLSDDFWQCYAEPVELFLESAVLMKKVMEAFQVERRGRGVARLEQSLAAYPGEDAFRVLLSSVSPTFTRDQKRPNRRPQRTWLAPSLIGIFAAMLLDDLTTGKNIRRCDACPNLFASGPHAPTYCSSTCRWRSAKQRQRKAKSAKNKSRSKTSRRGPHRRSRGA